MNAAELVDYSTTELAERFAVAADLNARMVKTADPSVVDSLTAILKAYPGLIAGTLGGAGIGALTSRAKKDDKKKSNSFMSDTLAGALTGGALGGGFDMMRSGVTDGPEPPSTADINKVKSELTKSLRSGSGGFRPFHDIDWTGGIPFLTKNQDRDTFFDWAGDWAPSGVLPRAAIARALNVLGGKFFDDSAKRNATVHDFEKSLSNMASGATSPTLSQRLQRILGLADKNIQDPGGQGAVKLLHDRFQAMKPEDKQVFFEAVKNDPDKSLVYSLKDEVSKITRDRATGKVVKTVTQPATAAPVNAEVTGRRLFANMPAAPQTLGDVLYDKSPSWLSPKTWWRTLRKTPAPAAAAAPTLSKPNVLQVGNPDLAVAVPAGPVAPFTAGARFGNAVSRGLSSPIGRFGRGMAVPMVLSLALDRAEHVLEASGQPTRDYSWLPFAKQPGAKTP